MVWLDLVGMVAVRLVFTDIAPGTLLVRRDRLPVAAGKPPGNYT